MAKQKLLILGLLIVFSLILATNTEAYLSRVIQNQSLATQNNSFWNVTSTVCTSSYCVFGATYDTITQPFLLLKNIASTNQPTATSYRNISNYTHGYTYTSNYSVIYNGTGSLSFDDIIYFGDKLTTLRVTATGSGSNCIYTLLHYGNVVFSSGTIAGPCFINVSTRLYGNTLWVTTSTNGTVYYNSQINTSTLYFANVDNQLFFNSSSTGATPPSTTYWYRDYLLTEYVDNPIVEFNIFDEITFIRHFV